MAVTLNHRCPITLQQLGDGRASAEGCFRPCGSRSWHCLQHEHGLPRRHRDRPAVQRTSSTTAACSASMSDFHLHRFDDHQRVACCHPMRRRRRRSARRCRSRGAPTAMQPSGTSSALRRAGADNAATVSRHDSARLLPALALGFERRLLARLERARWMPRCRARNRPLLAEAESRLLDAQREPPVREVLAHLQQLVRRTRDRSGSGRRSAAATACRRGSRAVCR